MPRPLRIQYSDAWYHVMNRSRRGEDVFTGKKDYNAFIDLLKELVEDYNVNADVLFSSRRGFFIGKLKNKLIKSQA